jgi:hypothetical protein
MTIKHIKELLDKRDQLLEQDEKNKEIDEIQELITACFKKDLDSYPFDFVFETLTRFGQAPQLVYDDNGMFAITCAGYSPCVMGDERIEGSMTAFVEKDQWHKSCMEAMHHYLHAE